jgi:hypothetical protein
VSALSPEDQIIEDIAGFRHDPLGYVMYAFPWGEPGSELEHEEGPREWQREFLEELGRQLRSGVDVQKAIEEAIQKAIRMAVASGHGIGKSALVAWIILWALSTLEDTRGVVTANTATQLETKTWPELAVWYRRAINRDWFVYTATSIYSADPKHEKTWRFDAIPWSVHNTEAFAGLHNKRKRVVVIFDEASAVHDKIWEVTEGALTDEDTEIIWCVFGNPTRNTGRFRQAFGKFRHRWWGRQIDSRTVPGTNKTEIQQWIDDYGEDSDFVRIRVRGRFPRASSMQFIPSDLVEAAQKREARYLADDPLIMMLDIARGGDDNCVFRFRRGLNARAGDGLPKVVRIPGSEVHDSMKLVSQAIELIEQHQPDYFVYDGTGVGGPVGDRIKQLGYNVHEVQFGKASPNPKYLNMRAYMYAKMKEWLQAGGAIDDDPVLETDLTNVQHDHNGKDQLFLLSKKYMKEKLGLASPDDSDALAMSFAVKFAPKSGPGSGGGQDRTYKSEYNPYEDAA